MFIQQVHKKCGGEIVVVASKGDISFACKRCTQIFRLSIPYPISCKDLEDVSEKDRMVLNETA